MNGTLETKVWEETVPNVMKFFGDEWVQAAANVRRRGVEISPRHPKGSVAELACRGLKSMVNCQRRRGRVGLARVGNPFDEVDGKSGGQWVGILAFWKCYKNMIWIPATRQAVSARPNT